MLKQQRIKKGLTQAQLGKRIRKNKSYVSRLERRDKNFNPSLNLILDLSKELNCCPIKVFIFFTRVNCKYFGKD